ncbi:MAG: class I SAM-dependent methyltransferase [Candidatus Odinarchaeia archaeon]
MISWYQEAVNRISNRFNSGSFIALDIGTGFGHLAFKLKKMFNSVLLTAIDLNPDNLKVALSNSSDTSIYKIEWSLMDGGISAFRDNVFDLVLSAFSVQYWDDPLLIFNEIARILREDGVFLITDLRRDMSDATIRKIADLSAANNPQANSSEIEQFLRIRLRECYTPKEITKIVKKSDLKNWRIVKRTYGYYLESKI